jgi:hypothetical protein
MDAQQRLDQAAANAKQAEESGDDGLAGAEWRKYRLIKDSTRDPEDLPRRELHSPSRPFSWLQPLGDRIRPNSPSLLADLEAVLERLPEGEQ